MFETIITIFMYYIVLSFFFRNSAVGMIEAVGINRKMFPKHYVFPSKWIRKHFKLKTIEIPRYLLFRLYASMFFCVFAPIVCIVILIFQLNHDVVKNILVVTSWLLLFDTTVFLVLSGIFKKR